MTAIEELELEAKDDSNPASLSDKLFMIIRLRPYT